MTSASSLIRLAVSMLMLLLPSSSSSSMWCLIMLITQPKLVSSFRGTVPERLTTTGPLTKNFIKKNTVSSRLSLSPTSTIMKFNDKEKKVGWSLDQSLLWSVNDKVSSSSSSEECVDGSVTNTNAAIMKRMIQIRKGIIMFVIAVVAWMKEYSQTVENATSTAAAAATATSSTIGTDLLVKSKSSVAAMIHTIQSYWLKSKGSIQPTTDNILSAIHSTVQFSKKKITVIGSSMVLLYSIGSVVRDKLNKNSNTDLTTTTTTTEDGIDNGVVDDDLSMPIISSTTEITYSDDVVMIPTDIPELESVITTTTASLESISTAAITDTSTTAPSESTDPISIEEDLVIISETGTSTVVDTEPEPVPLPVPEPELVQSEIIVDKDDIEVTTTSLADTKQRIKTFFKKNTSFLYDSNTSTATSTTDTTATTTTLSSTTTTDVPGSSLSTIIAEPITKTFKQTASTLLSFGTSTSTSTTTAKIKAARKQPKSEYDERILQQKYLAIDSLEERAFQILLDLGMVELHDNLFDAGEWE